MKTIPSRLPRTTSPGMTVACPMRTAVLTPRSMIVGEAKEGCQPRTKQAKSGISSMPSRSRTEPSNTTPLPEFA